jgi:ribose-phosphate pyrophosphokinase
MDNLIIVGNVADNPFVEDIAHQFNQGEDYSDLISLKSFLNGEFCPRFIVDESDWENIGRKLEGKRVLVVSTSAAGHSRDELAMRNLLITRAANDNGAAEVILLEPDLYYSAQDRGPRLEHGITDFKRDRADYKTFDGQPFSARLYAELLQNAGTKEVVTVHNQSHSVKSIFMDRLSGHFHNLLPASVYADYIQGSDVVDAKNLVLCAPDKGALPFVQKVQGELGTPEIPILAMTKIRRDERDVEVALSPESPLKLPDVKGKAVAVLDDMVRTGRTIVQCCRLIKSAQPARVVFFVTHFFSSPEGRIILNDPSIDEIVTTNSIPHILNRDMQGRLRRKMVVLKIESWISRYLMTLFGGEPEKVSGSLYSEDMSSKNPRWRGKMGPLFL